MHKNKAPQPPKWATRFLQWYCRPDLLEDLEGDLNEIFQRNLQTRGPFTARLIYAIDTLKFCRPYTVRKPSAKNPFNRQLMLASYIKTSGKSIMRSKLFSAVNIVGLAISMSVGLLVLAVVSDLFSYDATLQNKDRIFRIVSSLQPAGQPSMMLASTTWKADKLIKEEVPGVEAIVNLRRGFGGDAKIGGSSVPVSGLYADQGFFDVFSFPLLQGVAATALKEPHSLVLTETSATKLFGHADPMGKVVKIDSVNYTVTGMAKDIPKLSHLHFEMLVSLSSIDLTKPIDNGDGDFMDWTNVFSDYVYVLLRKNSNAASFTVALNRLSARENAAVKDRKILLSPQAIKNIPVGRPMANEIGPVTPTAELYILSGLALVIILSACFNYTNLSIARSLRRSREVGIRKVMGARRLQVISQFMVESIILSLLSLCFAFLIFLMLRVPFVAFHQQLDLALELALSPRLIGWFVLLALLTGILAGAFPALIYSKINAVKVLKDASSLKVFRHLNLRKALIVTQYTFSLIFITSTFIGYEQYKGFLRFDLGFTTTDVVNINMQGNNDEVFVKQLSSLPAVKGVSRSLLVSSLGSIYGSSMKYKDPADSTMVDLNYIDEHYLPLHQYAFLAGRNFESRPKNAPETETIVNQEMIRRFNIGHNNPAKAIGESISIDRQKLTIVGVLRDFHYGSLQSTIDPTAFRYSAEPGGYVNVKLSAANTAATLTSIETLWKQTDNIHPLDAKFYDDQIEHAYSQFSIMLKVIGFFAFLAICISSLGLFGMVIYTMEKRLKEISIRKVLGAGDGNLLFLLSKGFLFLFLIAAAIALPLTWLLFQKVILANFAYHQPIRSGDLFVGLLLMAGLVVVMIGMQTLKVVRANPARVLKTE